MSCIYNIYHMDIQTEVSIEMVIKLHTCQHSRGLLYSCSGMVRCTSPAFWLQCFFEFGSDIFAELAFCGSESGLFTPFAAVSMLT